MSEQGDADIGVLQCSHVIGAISAHENDEAGASKLVDNSFLSKLVVRMRACLLSGSHPRIDAHVWQQSAEELRLDQVGDVLRSR